MMNGRLMKTRLTLLTLIAAGSLIAGCQKASPPPAENQDQNVTAPEPKPAPLPTKPIDPMPAPPKPEAPKVKPAPKVTAEQQVIDDADATGMTSHVDRGGDTSPTPADAQK
jgi:PBP1b-binding outer membrane lipoprotein LpoB